MGLVKPKWKWHSVCIAEVGAADGPSQTLPWKEIVMKAIWLLMLLMVMGVGVVGCEIDGDADDDGARLEVDVGD